MSVLLEPRLQFSLQMCMMLRAKQRRTGLWKFTPHPRLFADMAAAIRNINGLKTSAVHNSGRWRCGTKWDDVEPDDTHQALSSVPKCSHLTIYHRGTNEMEASGWALCADMQARGMSLICAITKWQLKNKLVVSFLPFCFPALLWRALSGKFTPLNQYL